MTLFIENRTKRIGSHFQEKHFDYLIDLLKDNNNIENDPETKEISEELIAGLQWILTGNEDYLLPVKN